MVEAQMIRSASSSVDPDTFIEEVLEWAEDNFKEYYEPEDLFPYSTLKDWAKENGFVEEE